MSLCVDGRHHSVINISETFPQDLWKEVSPSQELESSPLKL